MRRAAVELVITEHPPCMTPGLARYYDVIRGRIERLAGVPVRSRGYSDDGDFSGAHALVLSGSFAPWAAHDRAALTRLAERVTAFNGPVLGICAGMQLQIMLAGGAIGPRKRLQVGYASIDVVHEGGLLDGLRPSAVAYEHHAHDVSAMPEGFVVLARSRDCAVEAVAAPDRPWWGTQFHPERFSAEHPDGARVLSNFLALAGLGRPHHRAAGSSRRAR